MRTGGVLAYDNEIIIIVLGAHGFLYTEWYWLKLAVATVATPWFDHAHFATLRARTIQWNKALVCGYTKTEVNPKNGGAGCARFLKQHVSFCPKKRFACIHNAIGQWFPTGGTRTPRGTQAHCRGYVETFNNHLCYVILFENHQHGGTHGMTNRLRGYTRQKRLGNTAIGLRVVFIVSIKSSSEKMVIIWCSLVGLDGAQVWYKMITC